jgi:hypothetical protein
MLRIIVEVINVPIYHLWLSDITLLKFKLIKIYTLSYYCLHVHVPYVLNTQKT